MRLTPTAIGALTGSGGRTLTAYVNGAKASGDPAAIALTAHREIALVYGRPGENVAVPSGYRFPTGE